MNPSLIAKGVAYKLHNNIPLSEAQQKWLDDTGIKPYKV
jgi:hypothetical protein